jgi:MscS family membrane protein
MDDSAELDLTPPDWLPASLETAWTLLSTYPLLLATLIVAVGIGLAFVARGFVLFWGLKVTRRTPTDLYERLLRLAAFAMVLVIGYLALVAAVQVLPLSPGVTQAVVRILVSMLVLHLMQSALKASSLGLQFLGRVRDRYAFIEERTLPLFDLISTILIIAITSYALFLVWEIDPTAWLASAGVIGIAVGFAARDTLANLFAGFSIIADAPCKLGDYVVLDTGERGEVTAIGMRSTRILTRDDVEIVVPNSEMANSKIINESGGRWVKFRTRLKSA